MRANSSTLLLTVGFLGAATVVVYGITQLVPRQHLVLPSSVLPAPATITHVLAAQRPIHRGDLIKLEDLGSIAISGAPPATAITSQALVIGKLAVQDIAPNQLILEPMLSADATRAGLASLVQPGFRAVQLRTTDEIAVGNFLRAGDHVDIQLLLPDPVLPNPGDAQKSGSVAEARTLLQNVTVLAVGEQLGAPPDTATDSSGRRPDPPRGVTVALTPDQVPVLALGRGLGTLFLTLRNPTDLATVTLDTTKLAGIRGRTPPSSALIVEGKRPIELITGNRTQTIYSHSGDSQPGEHK